MQISSNKYNLNSEFVMMPWDDKNTMIIYDDGSAPQAYSRWELIKKHLKTSEISTVEVLVNTIKSYNVVFDENGKQILPNWNFLALFKYFSQLNEFEKKNFFQENGVLSTIRSLSLQLKESQPFIKILKTGYKSSITLHQLQVASILANAFLCTFPKGRADCPSINFNTLFEGSSSSISQYFLEKIKCLIHYFKRIHQKQPSGFLSFHRLNIPNHKFPRWDKSNSTLSSLKVDFQGMIEDQFGYLQMDFANKYVGGGVLGKGCVQEEIRFLICPELIAARLFTECLADNESLFVVGAERFCQYTGYSNTFKFAGDYVDKTPFDEKNHRKTYLIVLDALYYHRSSEQYRESKILRELKKAYVGFKPLETFKTLPLATGNWGCGAFGGDPQLKSLIQLMASSEARRDVLYLTFGNSFLKNQIEELYIELKRNAVTVGTLYNILKMYIRTRERSQTVFEFVTSSMKELEKKRFSPKSTPSTSQKAVGTMLSSDAREATFGVSFPDMDLDFDKVDKEVQEHLTVHSETPNDQNAASPKVVPNYPNTQDSNSFHNSRFDDYLMYFEEWKYEGQVPSTILARKLSASFYSSEKEKSSGERNTSPVLYSKSKKKIPRFENNAVVMDDMSLCEYMRFLTELECEQSKKKPEMFRRYEKSPENKRNSPESPLDYDKKDLNVNTSQNAQEIADAKHSFSESKNEKKIKKMTQSKITDCFSKK